MTMNVTVRAGYAEASCPGFQGCTSDWRQCQSQSENQNRNIKNQTRASNNGTRRCAAQTGPHTALLTRHCGFELRDPWRMSGPVSGRYAGQILEPGHVSGVDRADQGFWRVDSARCLCRSSSRLAVVASAGAARSQQAVGNSPAGIAEAAVDQFTSERVGVLVEKTGLNSRRVIAKIRILAPLATVWSILTDYARLGEYFPNLAENKLLERRPNGARLLQVGEQDVALGLKFRAKAVMDVEEVAADTNAVSANRKRDINFKIVEGDFQVFEGIWRLEEETRRAYEGDEEDSLENAGELVTAGAQNCREGAAQTVLSYFLDVKPHPWLPVGLVEGRIRKEIVVNLLSVQIQARQRLASPL